VFLQLLDEPEPDLPVPETEYSFGQIIGAQALGDYQALVQRGRRVLRVQLGTQAERGLGELVAAVEQAVGVARHS
jgi:transaldolase / glucose-6-phosphate isomerase